MFTHPNVSCVACHMSRVMCHMSRVTCHMSRFFSRFFLLFFFFSFFQTKWWSLSVEGLLSTGPTPSSLGWIHQIIVKGIPNSKKVYAERVFKNCVDKYQSQLQCVPEYIKIYNMVFTVVQYIMEKTTLLHDVIKSNLHPRKTSSYPIMCRQDGNT